jgi:hypothetical protein
MALNGNEAGRSQPLQRPILGVTVDTEFGQESIRDDHSSAVTDRTQPIDVKCNSQLALSTH